MMNTPVNYLELSELSSQIAIGDERAFARYVVLFNLQVYGTSLHITHCVEDAEDLAQEI